MPGFPLDFHGTRNYNVAMNAKRQIAKMGRPPKAKADKQSERIAVNVTRAEYRAIVKDAKTTGLSLSAYLLDCWKNRRS